MVRFSNSITTEVQQKYANYTHYSLIKKILITLVTISFQQNRRMQHTSAPKKARKSLL